MNFSEKNIYSATKASHPKIVVFNENQRVFTINIKFSTFFLFYKEESPYLYSNGFGIILIFLQI